MDDIQTYRLCGAIELKAHKDTDYATIIVNTGNNPGIEIVVPKTEIQSWVWRIARTLEVHLPYKRRGRKSKNRTIYG